MKKLLLFFSVCILYSGIVMAQTSNQKKAPAKTVKTAQPVKTVKQEPRKEVLSVSGDMKNCCFMKEGKMVCITEGKEIPIETEITMKNGMKCMPDGTCIGKDGTKIMLKEGYCCDINGKVFLMPIKDDQPKEIKLETVPN